MVIILIIMNSLSMLLCTVNFFFSRRIRIRLSIKPHSFRIPKYPFPLHLATTVHTRSPSAAPPQVYIKVMAMFGHEDGAPKPPPAAAPRPLIIAYRWQSRVTATKSKTTLMPIYSHSNKSIFIDIKSTYLSKWVYNYRWKDVCMSAFNSSRSRPSPLFNH